MPYTFTGPQQLWFQGQTHGWSTAIQWGALAPMIKVISGVTCKIYKEMAETPDHHKAKLETLKDAIETLQSAGLMFTDADVHEFKVAFYGTGPSRGVVYFEPAKPLPTVVLMLGNRITEHIISGIPFTTLNIAGGSTLSPKRVLADRFYDYYRVTHFISSKKKSQLAQALHELGHIFHQLLSPAEYILNAEVANGNMAHPGAGARSALLPNIVLSGKTHVSQYAGVGGDPKTLNEYVAEVFCGLMMGVDWNTLDTTGNVMAHYTTLGGPVPPSPRDTLKRHTTFSTQQCNCPGAGTGKWNNDAKLTW